VSIGDTLASLYGVIGALMALHHRTANGGNGQFVDVALYEAVFGVMESLIPEFTAFGHVRERTGASLPGIVPSNTYLCRDGLYVIIAGNSDSIYRRLMHAIGRGDLAEDPRLAQNDGRAQNTALIDDAIGVWTRQHDLDTVLALLNRADVPSARIYTAADIAKDPQFQARDMIQSYPLPDGMSASFPGIVPKLSETPGSIRWLGPKLGEHTDQVLESIGIAKQMIAELREQGVI
jgi:crotonobetainyl-CoA:carnitine CoA-transferase CaiB-like acyl-CoA transferase